MGTYGRALLAINPTLPSDKVHSAVDAFLSHANRTLSYLQRIFLVEDLIDSFKVKLPFSPEE